MNSSPRLGPVDRHRLDDLVRRSNAGLYSAMSHFVDGGHRPIGELLRGGSLPDPLVQRFLDELQSMQDYVGTSYRVSQITRGGLAALQGTGNRCFVDLGAQCAFVLPSNAAALARRRAAAQRRDGAHLLFSIFDESVPQKNLSTARFVDCVAVLPGTPLRLTNLRIFAAQGDRSSARARIVAHFAAADQACDAPYDLYSGAPRK
jgi:hypothetical protein